MGTSSSRSSLGEQLTSPSTPPGAGVDAATRAAELSIADLAERLLAAGCVAAEVEAQELLSAALDAETIELWARRRERGEPLAWIVGHTTFCGRPLRVRPGVYVPRAQTEELARRAGALLADHGRAVDLCAGSGAVAVELMAAVPTAAVTAVDIDPLAAACARENGARAVVADLSAGLRAGASDLVTAVAPYVPTGALDLLPRDVTAYEPHHALDGGPDGLDVVRRVVGAAARLLRPGGWLLVELGADQDQELSPTLRRWGFAGISPWYDDEGDLRGLAAQRT